MSRKKYPSPDTPPSRMPSRNQVEKRLAIIAAQDKPYTGYMPLPGPTLVYPNLPQPIIPSPEQIEANKKRELFIRMMGDVKKTVVRRKV